jgi:hypothetical protein
MGTRHNEEPWPHFDALDTVGSERDERAMVSDA